MKTTTTRPKGSPAAAGSAVPTDDSPRSIKRRAKAVRKSNALMPGLASMTKTQMRDDLQTIWNILDGCEVQRRNETAPEVELTIIGRIHALIEFGCKYSPNATLSHEEGGKEQL